MTRLQPLTRARVARLGAVGSAWADALPARVAELSETWGLELGRPLPGGSASYVVGARTHDGRPRVLKVLVPDPDLADEAPVLAAAAGVGYARLHAAEPDALLLEALGESLDRARPAPEDALGTLVRVLRDAWRVDPGRAGRVPVDKAAVLAADLDRHQRAVAPELAARFGRVVDAAREIARGLSASYDPGRGVLAHGDPHAGNLLRRGAGDEWAFVDPDGLLVEPEYDLGVALRDFSRRLLAHHDPVALHRDWVAQVAALAEVEADRVAAWALLERVSTGLFVCALGSEPVGRPFLESAERLLPGGP